MLTTTTLSDGRSLEYADLGDPDGVPVFLFHGTPGTSRTAGIFEPAASAQGVRLIASSRPGYGGSAPSPPGLASAAGDTVELADELGLDRFVTLGLSGGGPFALAVAVVAPERVTEVVIHGGSAAYFDVMPSSDEDAAERHALATYLAGDLDGALAELARSGEADFGELRSLSEADFAAAMSANSPPGESWLEHHPEARAIFLADFRRAIADPAGYSRDTLSWGSAWDIDLGAVTAPVRLIYGEADTMVPIVHAEWLLERLPTAELVVVSGGHGDVTFGAGESTFKALREAT